MGKNRSNRSRSNNRSWSKAPTPEATGGSNHAEPAGCGVNPDSTVETEQKASGTPSPTPGKSTSENSPTPATWIRVLFSAAVIIQFCGLYLALSANLFQSRLQQELMSFAAPYLVTTGQQYGTQPLELTHAEAFDLPLQVELLMDESDQWKPLPLSVRQQYSRWPNLARRLRLIIEDDIESEILADFAYRFAMSWEELEGSNEIQAIRYVQPFTPNFDEGSALAQGRGGLLETSGQVLYLATAIRRKESLLGFVPSQERYRSSKASLSVAP